MEATSTNGPAEVPGDGEFTAGLGRAETLSGVERAPGDLGQITVLELLSQGVEDTPFLDVITAAGATSKRSESSTWDVNLRRPDVNTDVEPDWA